MDRRGARRVHRRWSIPERVGRQPSAPSGGPSHPGGIGVRVTMWGTVAAAIVELIAFEGCTRTPRPPTATDSTEDGTHPRCSTDGVRFHPCDPSPSTARSATRSPAAPRVLHQPSPRRARSVGLHRVHVRPPTSRRRHVAELAAPLRRLQRASDHAVPRRQGYRGRGRLTERARHRRGSGCRRSCGVPSEAGSPR